MELLQQVNRTFVRWNKRTWSYFGGCDYFRLASDKRVLSAMRTGLRRYGLNVSASRLTTGNHLLYEQLEAALADFFQTPAATLVPSGFSTGAIVAQALNGRFSRVLMDEKAHPSLVGAGRHFGCEVETFEHRNPGDLARLLARGGARDKPIVLTDGLFSHSGETAPLAAYLKILPTRGLILVDDAHGAGILGDNGRGTPEYAGVSRERIIQTISLSKAFGVYGGAILGPRELREKILQASPIFAGSTPLPLPLAAAALKAVQIVRREPRLRRRLERNTQKVKSALRQQGFPVPAAPTPIIAFHPATPEESSALRERLLARKIFPSFIRYPGGPAAGWFRFAISSEHTPAQLRNMVSALASN